MTTEAAIARENAIGIEAILTAHSKRRDGGINISFKVLPQAFADGHGLPQELIDADIGTKFVLALVAVSDDGQPIAGAANDDEPAASLQHSLKGPPVQRYDTTTTTNHPDDALTLAPSAVAQDVPAPGRRSLAQRAGAMCADEDFWRYLHVHWQTPRILNEDSAAQYLRQFCHVRSRKEFDENAAAGSRFAVLCADFIHWRDSLMVKDDAPAF